MVSIQILDVILCRKKANDSISYRPARVTEKADAKGNRYKVCLLIPLSGTLYTLFPQCDSMQHEPSNKWGFSQIFGKN